MKLYATVKSERASKGQGGNKDILAVFTAEISGQRQEIVSVAIVNVADSFYAVEVRMPDGHVIHENVSQKGIQSTKDRLEELRKELRAERISYGELVELQSLAKYIDPSDVELLEAAGVPETKNEHHKYCTRCGTRTFDSAGFADGLCDTCWQKETKGNKQKGDKCDCARCSDIPF